ncbi:hypothetical protein [Jiangella alba]|uniref:hypothetical protein n=1 Tax=Jiangella alba TaxID=561176 RepID=UPI00083EFEE3|nr:hypothetical protein [Jiangella alba]
MTLLVGSEFSHTAPGIVLGPRSFPGYLGELIEHYDAEGEHGCFVFTFAVPDVPHHDDPRLDLDKAG